MKRFFCAISVISALFTVILAPARAKEAPVDALLAKIQTAEKTFQTLRFTFTQRTLVQVTGEEQVLKGQASFRKPNLFRVEHLEPRPLTAVSDGKTLWLYNPVRKQVMADSWDTWSANAGFPRGLGFFQSGSADLRQRYNVSVEGGNVLLCTPKDPDAWPYTLRVWVDPATGLPQKTELASQSLRTVTEVGAMEVNPTLPDDVFIFKTPAGAETFGTPAGPEEPKK